MKIYVMSKLYAVKTASGITIPHAIISINDPTVPGPVEFPPNEHRIALLPLKFFDIDASPESSHLNPVARHHISKMYGYGFFNKEQAAEIVEFVKQYQDQIKALIVHCDAGISRSSGVGAAIMKVTTGDDSPIFNSKMYQPNMHVYRKTLNAFHDAGMI